jgi:hypothetical protein
VQSSPALKRQSSPGETAAKREFRPESGTAGRTADPITTLRDRRAAQSPAISESHTHTLTSFIIMIIIKAG